MELCIKKSLKIKSKQQTTISVTSREAAWIEISDRNKKFSLHIATCPTMIVTPIAAEASPANRHQRCSKGRAFNCIRHYVDGTNIINMTFFISH